MTSDILWHFKKAFPTSSFMCPGLWSGRDATARPWSWDVMLSRFSGSEFSLPLSESLSVSVLTANCGVERIHASRVNAFLCQNAEKAPWDTFLASSEASNDGLGASSYHFVMPIYTEMPSTGELDEIFDYKLQHWKQSSPFINAFVRQALISSQFVYPVAKFIKWNVEDTTQAIKPNINQDGSSFFFLGSQLSSSTSSCID